MADATGRKGRVVRHHRFAEQGFGDRSAEQIRDLGYLFARVQSALSNQDRDLAPAVQDIGGGAQLIGRGLVDHGHPRGRRSGARIAHRALVCSKPHHLRVLRHGEMGDSTIPKRCAAGPVRDHHSVFRPGHFDIVKRNILHQLRRVDALLAARSDQVMERHAGDRDGSGANGRIWHAMMSAELPEGWA